MITEGKKTCDKEESTNPERAKQLKAQKYPVENVNEVKTTVMKFLQLYQNALWI